MKPDHCPTPDELQAYLNDSLDAGLTRSIEDHVEVCEICESRIQQLLDASVFLNADHPTSEDLNQRPGLDHYVCEADKPIGVGGFGVVWKMTDQRLNREVAVKVMRSQDSKKPALVRRFLAEAQICSQLDHPFIVPVYEVGQLSDGRGYYVMKLVKGDRLDQTYIGPADNWLSRLRTFANVCEAIAFAHERDVIHRDLKPQNIMVGEHGEVQVMDWGLAKTVGSPVKSHVASLSGNIVTTARRETDQTAAAAIGTYSYMPPEQATNAEDIDFRSDVFSLGAVLCQLLTGKPPYVATENVSVRELAATAQLDGARERLSKCQADTRILKLANRCLAEKRDERPANAAELSQSVQKFLREFEDELLNERIAREKQKVEYAAEAKRRGVRNRIGFAIGALILIGLFSVWNYYSQRSYRISLLQEDSFAAIDNTKQLINAKLLPEAKNELLRVTQRFEITGVEESLSPFADVNEMLADVELALNLIAARDALTYTGVGFNNKEVIELCRQAFEERGWDVTNMSGEAVESLANSTTRDEVFPHLDFMVGTALHLMANMKDSSDKTQLDQHVDHWLEILRQVDPKQKYYPKLRDRNVWSSPAELIEATEKASNVVLHWSLYDLIYDLLVLEKSPADGVGLVDLNAEEERKMRLLAEQLRRKAQQNYPDDGWVNYQLGTHLISDNEPENDDEVPRYFQAAIALAPDNPAFWTNLAYYHTKKQETEKALECYLKALEFDPDHFQGNFNLAALYHLLKQFKKGEPYVETAIRVAPDYWMAHYLKAELAREQGQLKAALKAYEQAIKLNPDHPAVKGQIDLVNQQLGEQNSPQAESDNN